MADPMVHFELTGTDRKTLGRFYAELLGWHVDSVAEPPYTVIDAHAGPGSTVASGRWTRTTTGTRPCTRRRTTSTTGSDEAA
jgi:predicted enzyme related to lactoylglutathione lyase